MCWHKWGKWTDVAMSVDKVPFQLRKCTKCDKTQVAVVKIKGNW